MEKCDGRGNVDFDTIKEIVAKERIAYKHKGLLDEKETYRVALKDGREKLISLEKDYINIRIDIEKVKTHIEELEKLLDDE